MMTAGRIVTLARCSFDSSLRTKEEETLMGKLSCLQQRDYFIQSRRLLFHFFIIPGF